MPNKFDDIYDNMTFNYSKLEIIISELYQEFLNNPDDVRTKYLIESLGTVAQGLIFSQREFTLSYGEPNLKESLIDNLDAKEEALLKALEDTKERTK